MTPDRALLAQAIQAAGGLNKVARQLGVASNRLANWLKRGVPVARCPEIEAVTGLRCEILRPDVHWDVLRRSTDVVVRQEN